MDETADQSLGGRGNAAGESGKAAERKPVQTGGEPHRPAEQRSADNSGQHRADGPGVGDGVFDVQAEIGAENRKGGKDKIEDQQLPGTQVMAAEGTEEGRFGEEVGDDQKDRHLLQEREDVVQRKCQEIHWIPRERSLSIRSHSTIKASSGKRNCPSEPGSWVRTECFLS